MASVGALASTSPTCNAAATGLSEGSVSVVLSMESTTLFTPMSSNTFVVSGMMVE